MAAVPWLPRIKRGGTALSVEDLTLKSKFLYKPDRKIKYLRRFSGTFCKGN
jgi:hypothetical protein